MRPRVIFKGTSEEHVKQKQDGVSPCNNAEKDLPKVTSTVVFLMHSEWSDFLNSCKCQARNNFFWF